MSTVGEVAELAAKDASYLVAAEACLRHWDGALPVDVADEDKKKFEICYPLVAHSLNQVNAALVLMKADQPFVAAVNARTAFEHALTAQWVILTYGGEQILAMHMEASHLTQVKEFSKAIGDPLELAGIVDRLGFPWRARSDGGQRQIMIALGHATHRCSSAEGQVRCTAPRSLQAG
jgi:hypothetical protein